jgi:hypothetical protein
MIKAIPTEYDGHHFRSRLEARWAVFFNMAGIGYRYELEGYKDTETGLCYLPDFYLPFERAWLEVKPFVPSPREEEKADLAARSPISHRCLVVEGDPFYPAVTQFTFQEWNEGNELSIDHLANLQELGELKSRFYAIDEQGATGLRKGILTWEPKSATYGRVVWGIRMAAELASDAGANDIAVGLMKEADELAPEFERILNDKDRSTRQILMQRKALIESTISQARRATLPEIEQAMIAARQWRFY